MDELLNRSLKRVSVEQLEMTIAEAITKLLGKEYEAQILDMDFNPNDLDYSPDRAACKLILSRRLKLNR